MEIETGSLRTACADLNGQMRGTRMPASRGSELEYSGQRLPLSTMALDIWGAPGTESSLMHASGNADGQMRCTDRDPVAIPWLTSPTTLVPMWMFTEDGAPFGGDPRHSLARVLKRFKKRGWQLSVSASIEFSLFEKMSESNGTSTRSQERPTKGAPEFAALTELDRFSEFFDALFAGAEKMSIALEQCASASGAGQFSLELAPASALRTADDLWLLKALVRGTARQLGLKATFMAKPLEDEPGNGLFLRFLIRDKDGRNLFDNGLMSGSSVLRQAVAGCVAGMPGSMLIFAPFANSYDRVQIHSQAPVGASWGYENRTTALRIPGGDPQNRRIEHRAPGSDSNPFICIAAILGSALMGIDDELTPPAPIIGDAYQQRILQTPTDWEEAINRFSQSPKIARFFPPQMIELLVEVKRREQHKMARLSPEKQAEVLIKSI